MDSEWKNLLQEGAKELGFPLEEEQTEKLLLYMEKVIVGNKKANLTSTSQPRELILKHFLDSLTCMPLLPENTGFSLLDIGSGAGFPGMVIKLCRPDIDLTLLEASSKKTSFLSGLVADLLFPEVKILAGRAETYGQDVLYREKYQVVVSRAVAPLNVLLEYALPFLEVGGVFIAQKGPGGWAEIKEAARSLNVLGCEVGSVEKVLLPVIKDRRVLVSVIKKTPTEIKYPRRPGLPKKRPL